LGGCDWCGGGGEYGVCIVRYWRWCGMGWCVLGRICVWLLETRGLVARERNVEGEHFRMLREHTRYLVISSEMLNMWSHC
jgi:hypothetical protein